MGSLSCDLPPLREIQFFQLTVPTLLPFAHSVYLYISLSTVLGVLICVYVPMSMYVAFS